MPCDGELTKGALLSWLMENNGNKDKKMISVGWLWHVSPLQKVHGASKNEKRTIAGKDETRIIERRLVY